MVRLTTLPKSEHCLSACLCMIRMFTSCLEAGSTSRGLVGGIHGSARNSEYGA
jgi:hypothetical protein